MTKFLLVLCCLFVCASTAHAQGTATTIRYGATLPATCVANTGQQFSLTSGTKGMYECKTTNTWTIMSAAAVPCTTTVSGLVPTPPNDITKVLRGDCTFAVPPGPLGAQTIFATTYGVTANGRFCYGGSSTIVVTNGSATVSCSTGNFTSGDIGKYIFGTTGCCGTTYNFQGILLIKGTISSITNSTTVVVSATAGAGCTGATCVLGWGTLDDTTLTAAEAAVNAQTVCAALQLPTGYIFLKEPHFTAPSGACQSVTFSQSYGGIVNGTGPGSTLLTIVPDFNFGACGATALGSGITPICFFNYLTPVVQNLGFWGGGYGNTGTHSGALIGLMQGAQSYQLTCAGFGGSDLGNFVGIYGAGGNRNIFMTSDGCGSINMSFITTADNAWNYCYWCFAADGIAQSLRLGSGPFYDYGSEYGPSGIVSGALYGSDDAVVDCEGCTLYAYGTSLFINLPLNSLNNSGLAINSSGTAYLYSNRWINDATACATTCNGLAILDSGSKVYSWGSTFKGLSTGVDIYNAGTFYDMGGNTFATQTGGGVFGNTTNLAPTISSGFGTSPSVTNNNGTLAFTINVGTGGTATSGVIGLPKALHGWTCRADDLTTQSAGVASTVQTASSTTTATLTQYSNLKVATAWAASDVLSVSCSSY